MFYYIPMLKNFKQIFQKITLAAKIVCIIVKKNHGERNINNNY